MQATVVSHPVFSRHDRAHELPELLSEGVRFPFPLDSIKTLLPESVNLGFLQKKLKKVC
jgi:hypothetical protein